MSKTQVLRRWVTPSRIGAIFAIAFAVANSSQGQSFNPEKLAEIRKKHIARTQTAAEQAKLKSQSGRVKLELRDGGPKFQFFERRRPIFYTPDNLNAAGAVGIRSIRFNDLDRNGFLLDGSDILVGMWDVDAPLTSHVEFGSPSKITVQDGASPATTHATHVAGTIGALGVDAAAKGMAPGAAIDAYDFESDITEIINAAAAGLTLSNHSYSLEAGWHYDAPNWLWYGDPSISVSEDFYFGFYSDVSALLDDVCYNAPNYLIVRSAANNRGVGPFPQPISHYVVDSNNTMTLVSGVTRPLNGGLTPGSPTATGGGFDTIPGGSNGKNILTVAAAKVLNGTYTQPSDVVPATVTNVQFSGRGPTDDGRIKPDLVAPGEAVYSATITAPNYGPATGTSQAAPVVTGSVALLQQLRVSLGEPPLTSASMKALLINTADEAGAFTGPDYVFGWGLLNTEQAAKVINVNGLNDTAKIIEGVLTNGATHTYSVWSDIAPFKVTMAWTDPAGTPPPDSLDPTTAMLVNDLDLRLIRTTTTHKPFVLQPAFPDISPIRSDNTRDNVEQVLVESPTVGVFQVQVTHKGVLPPEGQAYSLVINRTPKRESWRQTIDMVDDDYATDCAVDIDGNTYLFGRQAVVGNNDVVLMKLGRDGRPSSTWADTGHGVGVRVIDYASFSTKVSVDANYVYAFASAYDTGGAKLLTLKFDRATGTLSSTWPDVGHGAGVRWETSYSAGFAKDMVVLPTGEVYVCGDSGNDFVTVKYSAAGTKLWGAVTTNTATSSEASAALAIDNSGNAIVVGSTATSVLAEDYFIAKLKSSDGSLLWKKTYNSGAAGSSTPDRAYGVACDSSGNVHVTGTANGSIFTRKYNSAGTVQWSHNDPGTSPDGGLSIHLSGSDIYVLGASGGATKILKLTSTGTLSSSWAADPTAGNVAGVRSFGKDGATMIVANGSLYVACRVAISPSDPRIQTVRIDANTGAFVWKETTFTQTGIGSGVPAGIARDPLGPIVTFGYDLSPIYGRDWIVTRYYD